MDPAGAKTDRRYRIGIDVGGTFTDFVMAEQVSQRLIFHKEPSVPADPALAISRGIGALLAMESADPADIEIITHGTTIGLNAIIQERGCRVALVVSRGNRDVMELARGRLPSSYNFKLGREKALVGRRDVFEVGGRALSDGDVWRDVDPAELDEVAASIRERGYDAVAVMLLNSYREPRLEEQVADGLAERLGGIPVTASSRIWPEVKEYERALVAVLNAYIHPLMSNYFDRLAAYLAEAKVTAALYITSNNGGTMSITTARERPVDTILSGPASGVRAAALVGQGPKQLLTFDMGGTSTDVSMILDGELELSQTAYVGDYPLMLPVVRVSAIGAGGGSIAWRDAQGVLKVGPESAGAMPGPVCYGRGGQNIAVTDALLAMGVLHPDRFLSGRMRLDTEAANRQLVVLGEGLGLSGAAEIGQAVCHVATVKMATELTKVLAQKGLDPRECVLVAFGGAGPTTALMLAEEAGIDSVLVPPSPGTFCALGALLADVRRDFVRPCRLVVEAETFDAAGQQIGAIIQTLKSEAMAWIEGEGDHIRSHEIGVAFDMRYPGQSFDFRIAAPQASDGVIDIAGHVQAFHAEHERIYGFHQPGAVEVVNIRLSIVGRLTPVGLAPPAINAEPVPPDSRKVLLDGWQEVPVIQRATLAPGQNALGPLIVEQADTTTLVLPGWQMDADIAGNLWLKRMAA